jgi:glucose-1-phosphate thymidylyltransferase
MKMGGILLCGGYGSRLFPTTKYINKHLIPIYDKPMIYYSLSTLLLAGMRDITIVCDPKDIDAFKKLLGNGDEFGVEINYSLQDAPSGISDAISKALDVSQYEKFITVLGDNFIFGQNFFTNLEHIYKNTVTSTIFHQKVKNPENFGVINFDDSNNIKSLIEKPKEYISNKAVIGLYIFDHNFQNYFKNSSPSNRNEYEILDIVNQYLENNLQHFDIGRGTAWFDMGTTEAFFNCSSFVRTIQERQDVLVCSPHEIAYRNNWINQTSLEKYISTIKGSEYSENLLNSLL